MKISIWIDERQLSNLQKLLNSIDSLKENKDENIEAVMFEKSEGYYPCDIQVNIEADYFILLRDRELLVLEEEQF
tara:strand:- start:2060 stop:2284 length:225 start_codon:yes stop_codon:yes gene_type:complete